MNAAWWDVMGSTAGYSLLMNTLDNIRDVAPHTAFERGAPIDLVYTGSASAGSAVAGAFASGVGSLTDAKA